MPLASLQDLELKILHCVTCRLESPLMDWVAAFVNDPLFGVPFMFLLWLVASLTRTGRERAGRVLLAALLALGLVHGVREIVWRTLPRARPASLFREDQILRFPIPRRRCVDRPDMWVERGHPSSSPAFPSSHTITAAAVAAALTFGSRWVGAVAWVFALLVGLGRLYWGKHWPTDVLGSLALGAVAGWVAWRLSPRVQGWFRKGLARESAGDASRT